MLLRTTLIALALLAGCTCKAHAQPQPAMEAAVTASSGQPLRLLIYETTRWCSESERYDLRYRGKDAVLINRATWQSWRGCWFDAGRDVGAQVTFAGMGVSTINWVHFYQPGSRE